MNLHTQYKILNTKYNIVAILLFLSLNLILTTNVYAQEPASKQNFSRFGELVKNVKRISNALILGDFTVRGKSNFLSPIAADDVNVFGDFTQGGTLFVKGGDEIDNIAGDLKLQPSGRGGVLFGQGTASLSKDGRLTAKGLTLKSSLPSGKDLSDFSYSADSSTNRKPAGETSGVRSVETPEVKEAGGELASLTQNLFQITTNGEPISSINNLGQATFTKLNIATSTDTSSSHSGAEDPASSGDNVIESTSDSLDETGSKVDSINLGETSAKGNLRGSEGSSEVAELAEGNTSENRNAAGSGRNSLSIGSATLPAEETMVTVQTSAVTENSKIFVTPTTSTNSQTLFIQGKTANKQFTVAIDNEVKHDISFNWWVIN